MKLASITLVLCAVACLAAGDGSILKAKARLFSKLGRHHKRGVLAGVPTYKVGYDIPHVSHSVVKPLVVTYPPAATVTTVKVPLSHPLIPHHPHRAPGHHPHFGLKFPHTKTVVLPRPNPHFHHHHHHVAPRPVVPVAPAVPLPAPAVHVPATPVVPIPQPTVTVARPLPPPPPPQVLVQPTPLLPAHHIPVGPPPVPIAPAVHSHLSPLLPAATIPLHQPVLPAPVPLAPQLQYVLRPGNAVQTSFFATYPRYPLVNQYQSVFPLAAPAAVAPPPVAASPGPVFLERPHVPHFHVAQGAAVVPHQHAVAVEPTPALVHETHAVQQPAFHLHPTQQVAVEHDGWAPVPTHPHDVPQFTPQEHHHLTQEAHPHFTQEQGTQVYEHHTGNEQQYHELQHHIQQQLDQAQYEQHLHNQHQLNQEYGAPQEIPQAYAHHDLGQHQQDFANHQQDFINHQQDFINHQQDFDNHQQDFANHQQDLANHQQDYAQHQQDFAHQQQDFAHDFHYQQPGSEYGTPGVEGRSSNEAEAEGDELKFRNHIPLGLQPPIDRPLEHFR
ncbi:uncharacterized protein LOC126373436 [Pectinophora gossypiella]|uniref:uncharacterized protein LOC126373436 n=1 Tax=Pectinophora gossypiella TaxID=13191 RepID=UPI00214EAC67|nr:uncharacterized protein LOC126373436 [Pectinophora gossypiella]